MYHKNYALDVQDEITASRRYFYLHAGTSGSNITFESSGSEILKGISAATIQMVILSSGLPLKLKLRLYLAILSSGAVYCMQAALNSNAHFWVGEIDFSTPTKQDDGTF